MPTDPNVVKWYNDNAEDYTKHVRNNNDSVYHAYYEKPAMYALLPDLKGKSVLSLGCGSGEDSEYLRKNGASRSAGIDISEKLIDIASKTYSECEFLIMNMENLDFPDETFNLVYSSLAMHYVDDWTNIFKEAYRVLKPNSFFVFSCGHPVRFSMETTKSDEMESIRQLGIVKNKKTKEVRIIGDYLNRKSILNGVGPSGELKFLTWHKSIGEIVKEAKSAGFLIDNFIEPKPLPEMKDISPASYEKLSKIPEFMIFKLVKLS